jgi:type I restriction enzyme M protein
MKPSLVSEDVIGNTYIYLIERFASDSGKKAGEFFTPLKVTELVARLAGPKPGDRICDPACGSGGLLIQAAKEVARNGAARRKSATLPCSDRSPTAAPGRSAA